MTAALIVLTLTGTLGMFAKSTVFSADAAAVRPASLGPTPLPGSRPAAGDDEQPAR
jgi:hypothetical protein